MMYLAVQESQNAVINGKPVQNVAKKMVYNGKDLQVSQCQNGRCKKQTLRQKKAIRRYIMSQKAYPMALDMRLRLAVNRGQLKKQTVKRRHKN